MAMGCPVLELQEVTLATLWGGLAPKFGGGPCYLSRQSAPGQDGCWSTQSRLRPGWWEQRMGWTRPPAAFSCPLQLGPGSPPGVWVCSTDMLLSVPENPGEPERAWARRPLPLPDAFPHLLCLWVWPAALFGREAAGSGEYSPDAESGLPSLLGLSLPVSRMDTPSSAPVPCRALWKDSGREGTVILLEECPVGLGNYIPFRGAWMPLP